MAAYPNALSYGPEGLAAKRSDLRFSDHLGPEFDKAFATDFRRFAIEGVPKLGESLFLHRQSATLIVTDFCFFMPEATGLTGLFAMLTGIKKAPRRGPSVRILIRNKAAFRESLQVLRTIDIRHLSMCHHHVLSVAASEALNQVLNQMKVHFSSRT